MSSHHLKNRFVDDSDQHVRQAKAAPHSSDLVSDFITSSLSMPLPVPTQTVPDIPLAVMSASTLDNSAFVTFDPGTPLSSTPPLSMSGFISALTSNNFSPVTASASPQSASSVDQGSGSGSDEVAMASSTTSPTPSTDPSSTFPSASAFSSTPDNTNAFQPPNTASPTTGCITLTQGPAADASIPSNTCHPSSTPSSKSGIIAGAVLAALAFILINAFGLYRYRQKKAQRKARVPSLQPPPHEKAEADGVLSNSSSSGVWSPVTTQNSQTEKPEHERVGSMTSDRIFEILADMPPGENTNANVNASANVREDKRFSGSTFTSNAAMNAAGPVSPTDPTGRKFSWTHAPTDIGVAVSGNNATRNGTASQKGKQEHGNGDASVDSGFPFTSTRRGDAEVVPISGMSDNHIAGRAPTENENEEIIEIAQAVPLQHYHHRGPGPRLVHLTSPPRPHTSHSHSRSRNSSCSSSSPCSSTNALAPNSFSPGASPVRRPNTSAGLVGTGPGTSASVGARVDGGSAGKLLRHYDIHTSDLARGGSVGKGGRHRHSMSDSSSVEDGSGREREQERTRCAQQMNSGRARSRIS